MNNREYTEIEKKILAILDNQYQKGLTTYGQTLVDCPDEDYEWNTMALEELVDAISYQVKENMLLHKKLRKTLTENHRYQVKMEQLFSRLDYLETELRKAKPEFQNYQNIPVK